MNGEASAAWIPDTSGFNQEGLEAMGYLEIRGRQASPVWINIYRTSEGWWVDSPFGEASLGKGAALDAVVAKVAREEAKRLAEIPGQSFDAMSNALLEFARAHEQATTPAWRAAL